MLYSAYLHRLFCDRKIEFYIGFKLGYYKFISNQRDLCLIVTIGFLLPTSLG